jgi:hypothetical protein
MHVPKHLFPLGLISILSLTGCAAEVAVRAPAPPVVTAAVVVEASAPPPALPVYEQPPCPAEGFLWTPGYWHYGAAGYFWVPGTWVRPPTVGLLWTPGYWGSVGGSFQFHEGYWGPHVGFYGGINYGFGYGGSGFEGGHWESGHFSYNTTVANVNTTVIHNTYVKNVTVVNNTTNVSFNGGSGGITTRPTEAEVSYEHETHQPATAAQTENFHAAAADPNFRASENHGRPGVAATAHPGEFKGEGVVASRESAPERPGPQGQPKAAEHANHGPAAGKPGQAQANAGQAHVKPAQQPHPPVKAASEQKPYHPKAPAPQQKAKPEQKKPEHKEEHKD